MVECLTAYRRQVRTERYRAKTTAVAEGLILQTSHVLTHRQLLDMLVGEGRMIASSHDVTADIHLLKGIEVIVVRVEHTPVVARRTVQLQFPVAVGNRKLHQTVAVVERRAADRIHSGGDDDGLKAVAVAERATLDMRQRGWKLDALQATAIDEGFRAYLTHTVGDGQRGQRVALVERLTAYRRQVGAERHRTKATAVAEGLILQASHVLTHRQLLDMLVGEGRMTACRHDVTADIHLFKRIKVIVVRVEQPPVVAQAPVNLQRLVAVRNRKLHQTVAVVERRAADRIHSGGDDDGLKAIAVAERATLDTRQRGRKLNALQTTAIDEGFRAYLTHTVGDGQRGQRVALVERLTAYRRQVRTERYRAKATAVAESLILQTSHIVTQRQLLDMLVGEGRMTASRHDVTADIHLVKRIEVIVVRVEQAPVVA